MLLRDTKTKPCLKIDTCPNNGSDETGLKTDTKTTILTAQTATQEEDGKPVALIIWRS